MALRCKADIYFLADNTGSMGNIIEEVQTNAAAMLTALSAIPDVDLVFGVGNYLDFPTSYTAKPYMVYYGGKYTTPIAAMSIGIGTLVTATWATGPVVQGTGTWPAAVTATYASPVSSFTIPASGQYRVDIRLLLDYIGTDNNDPVTIDIVSSISGIISTTTLNEEASPWSIEIGVGFAVLTIGEVLSVEITNNTAHTLDLRWDSSISIRSASSGLNPQSPYAYLHQLDPTADEAVVADSFNKWYAGFGGDYPEGWLYALDQLTEALWWRADTLKIIIIIGDSPPHDPICTAISLLGYAITEASVTTKLQDAGVVLVAASVNISTTGLDDSRSTAENYIIFCGASAIASGHATRMTAATGGYIQFSPDPIDVVDAIVDLITLALDDCSNVRRRSVSVALVGAS